MRLVRIHLSALLAALLAACGGSSPSGSDGGSDGGADAQFPMPQLDALAANTEDMAMATFMSSTLDYSCNGSATKPMGGDPIAVTFQLRDFQGMYSVPNTDVWLFTNDTIADMCNAPDCQMFTTDAMGNASVMMPAGGWYAYRVLQHDSPTPGDKMQAVFAVFQYNEPAPAAGTSMPTVTGNSVSGVTINLVPETLGVSRIDGDAIIAGRISDCSGGYVQNAIVRVYDPDGNPLLSSDLAAAPHYNYFNGTVDNDLPNMLQTATNVDGLYVVIQVPVINDQPYRVEAWGMLDGNFTMIGCETARIFANAVTILNLGPVRSDGPPECAQ